MFANRRRSLAIFTLLGLLIVLALGLRLWRIDDPDAIIFDEVYYVRHALSYCCSHEYYSDLHPPHAKIILSAAAYLSDYKGGYSFGGTTEGKPSAAGIPLGRMRALVACFGALLIPIIFALVRGLGGTRRAALIAATLALVDNGLLIDSRYVLINPILLVGIFGALAAFLHGCKQDGWRSVGLMALTGTMLGVALGTKLTGLTAFALIFLYVLKDIFANRNLASLQLWWSRSLWIIAPFIAIYLAGWAWHEYILSSSEYAHSTSVPLHFFKRLAHLHAQMFTGHLSLGGSDGIGSRWWGWPFNFKPIPFWDHEGAYRAFFGNVIIWTGCAAIAFLAGATRAFAGIGVVTVPRVFQRVSWWVPGVGVALAYLPNAFIDRVLYLYHYLPALVFSIVLAALLIDRIAFAQTPTSQLRRGLAIGYVFACIAYFAIFLPITLGIPSPHIAQLKKYSAVIGF